MSSIGNEEGKEVVYWIVGEDEIDIKNGKISWRFLLAHAVISKNKDDEVKIQKPSKEELMTILKIEYK